MYNFDPYNVLLSIATNIAVLLMTAFVLQGHIYFRKQILGNILDTQTFVYTLFPCFHTYPDLDKSNKPSVSDAAGPPEGSRGSLHTQHTSVYLSFSSRRLSRTSQ